MEMLRFSRFEPPKPRSRGCRQRFSWNWPRVVGRCSNAPWESCGLVWTCLATSCGCSDDLTVSAQDAYRVDNGTCIAWITVLVVGIAWITVLHPKSSWGAQRWQEPVADDLGSLSMACGAMQVRLGGRRGSGGGGGGSEGGDRDFRENSQNSRNPTFHFCELSQRRRWHLTEPWRSWRPHRGRDG